MENVINTQVSSIRKVSVKNPLTVLRVYKSEYQKKNTLTAELSQNVTTTSYYPSTSVSNSLSDNIFDTKDFGFAETEYKNEEKRIAWIDVPENSTVESVTVTLAKFPKAELYKILSNKPVLTEQEKYAINDPLLVNATIEVFASRQAVRTSDLKLALTNGKIQYRRIAFSKEGMSDKDERTSDVNDYFVTAELAAEINNVPQAMVSGQTL